jgi:hypothetical protein
LGDDSSSVDLIEKIDIRQEATLEECWRDGLGKPIFAA